MNQVLLYCRAGFEKDCAAEIQQKTTEMGIYGFPRVINNSAYVLFECYQDGEAEQIVRDLPLDSLIFARQMIAVTASLADLDPYDRISPILAVADALPKAGDLRVETPDNDEAKALLKFCRKFTVPLRQALRKQGVMLAKDNPKKPVIHLCFIAPGTCFVGYSLTTNNSTHYMGIPRMKFPADAPSRSTLKLEEAFHHFIPKEEWDTRLAPGLWAVDLGACPGGWTYQLVKRSMFVHAVDNGAMDESLMETGQVFHHAEDGFKFEPTRKNVTWLVCDMIEKPSRVAQLMGEWLIAGWAKEAMFNLKLPMSRRYEQVSYNLDTLGEFLKQHNIPYEMKAKHLYHDREEITVYLRRVKRQHSLNG